MLDHPSCDMPNKLAEKHPLIALTAGDALLETWCSHAITAFPEEANIIRNGNQRVLNKLVGRVMKASRGRADAVGVRTMLLELLRSTK